MTQPQEYRSGFMKALSSIDEVVKNFEAKSSAYSAEVESLSKKGAEKENILRLNTIKNEINGNKEKILQFTAENTVVSAYDKKIENLQSLVENVRAAYIDELDKRAQKLLKDSDGNSKGLEKEFFQFKELYDLLGIERSINDIRVRNAVEDVKILRTEEDNRKYEIERKNSIFSIVPKEKVKDNYSIEKPDVGTLVGYLSEIMREVKQNTRHYFNSTPLILDRKTSTNYYLDDLLVLGAITNSDIMITGSTGEGKSDLAAAVMATLFGTSGYENITISTGFDKDDFINVNFKKMKESSRDSAIESLPILHVPGVILNEINRTPELMQNFFIEFLQYTFRYKGKIFRVGMNQGKNEYNPYQFRILTRNKGKRYVGTCGMDDAVENRVPIEIPLDNFLPKNSDVENMLAKRFCSSLREVHSNGFSGKVLGINQGIEAIASSGMLSEDALRFLSYLNGLDNCVKTPNYRKSGNESFSPEVCNGCHHIARDREVCYYARKPSPRSLIDLKKTAIGFTLLKLCKLEDKKKITSNFAIELKDVISVAPFVLYNKMGLCEGEWLSKQFMGNKYSALTYILRVAYKRWDAYHKKFPHNKNKSLTTEDISNMKNYVENTDPWAFNLGELT